MYEQRSQAFGRVYYLWPGKHGDGDLRVNFNDAAPSHAELLAILWGILRAEDRYDEPWQDGRAMLWRLAEEIYAAPSWAEARLVIERAARSVEERRAA